MTNKRIQKLLVLSETEYYETHLSLLNCALPKQAKMTPTEIKVLATLMTLRGDVVKYGIGSTARKVMMERTNLNKPLSPAGLSNYIKSLFTKGVLYKTENKELHIHPVIKVAPESQVYMFKLVNKNYKTELENDTK